MQRKKIPKCRSYSANDSYLSSKITHEQMQNVLLDSNGSPRRIPDVTGKHPEFLVETEKKIKTFS